MQCKGLFIAASLSVSFANAEQASSFNVPADVAETYSCGPGCQAALIQANAVDLQLFGTGFDFDFYDTALNFSCSRPGDILKVQHLESSLIDITPDVSVYKIQYTSRDIHGAKVPATGVIILPDEKSEDPFNLIAFAHGTSGVFRGCAPSTSPNLYRGSESWSALIREGYAIVATDYAGLGNNYTTHKYVSHSAHANDLVYAVKAAQQAFPTNVSQDWVAVGHSQGGGAVWKLSEHKAVQKPSTGYLGGVSIAPAATKLHSTIKGGLDLLSSSNNTNDASMLAGMGQLIIAIKNVFPRYDPSWVGEKMKKRIELSYVGQYCVNAMSSLGAGLSVRDTLNSFDVSTDSQLKAFQDLNAPGQHSASRPLLIVHGIADMIAPVPGTMETFQDACMRLNPVHLSLYPGFDHDSIIAGASTEYLTFIRQRFAKGDFRNGCSQSIVQ